MNAPISDNQIFQLPDGRRLGYIIYGNPQANPVLFSHGIPGSRLQHNPDLSLLDELSLCIYAFDRPGIGLSTYQPQRQLLDWAEDIRAVCVGLKLERVAILGVSGGGPYTLACACRLAEKLIHVAVVSGLAALTDDNLYHLLKPRARLLFQTAKSAPFLLPPLFKIGLKIFGNQIDLIFEKLVGHLPAGDQAYLQKPRIQRMFAADVAEAFRGGSQGVVQELSVLAQPWGFGLEQIQLPVHLWHGIDDTIVPLALAQHNLKQLLNGQPHFIAGGGHFIALEHAPAIFSLIAEDFKNAF